MKRKIIALCLIVAMLGVAVISGTMAYFTDTAEAVNVMTIGSVKIEQNEWERTFDDAGAVTGLKEFTQGKELLPYVGTLGYAGNDLKFNGTEKTGAYRYFTMKNVIDKYVTVTNTGKSDAFVRTFIALEMGDADYATYDANIGISINLANGSEYQFDGAWLAVENKHEPIEIGGNKYCVWVLEHQAAVKPGETTVPSLLQVYLLNKATQEIAAKLDGNDNGTYDILAFSQAVQAGGFGSAREAFKAAFDDNSDTIKLPEAWTSTEPIVIPTVVNTAEELEDALNAATAGTTAITLGDDIVGDMTVVQNPDAKVVLDGNGYKYTGDIVVDGGSSTNTGASLVIQNVTFYAEEASDVDGEAFINLGDGSNDTRYVKNVTISNCTFDVGVNDKDLVAIKSYTGGDKNLTIENCTVSSNIHSLLQVKNVEMLTVTGCTVNSKNGVNLNSTTNAVISDCTFDVRGYAVRFGVNTGGNPTAEKNFILKNNEMKSACEDGDAVIMFRADAVQATLTLEGNTITGTTKISGNTAATTIIEK